MSSLDVCHYTSVSINVHFGCIEHEYGFGDLKTLVTMVTVI